MRLAYPVALAILFRVAMAVSDVSILGHKDSDYLAAAASALVWMNITASFLYRAFGSSLNTLCSQAYGAGNFKLVGIWLQQGLVFSSIAGIFVGFSWWWTEDILKGLRIDHKIAALAGKFAQWSIIWLPAQIWMEMLQRYFQAQHIIFPALAMNAIFVGINILLNLLFVFGIPASWWAKGISSSLHEHGWDGLGLIGSPIATSISRWLMLIFYWIYTCLYRKYHVKTFDGWSLTRSETFHPNRIRQYLVGQCLPSAVGVCLEQWQLEIVALFATRLGSNAIATHNATLEVFFLLTSFMFGLVAAVQIRIGTYLGGGQPLAAQQVAKIGLKVSLLIGGVIGICFILLRNWIGKIYSSDPSIWELAQHISLIVGAAYALLSFFYTGMSILNGTGRPLIVAIAYLIGCWCICLPLTYIFAFTLDQGLIGLWYGLCCGYGVVTLIVTYASFRTDWSKCSELAQLRAELHRPNRTDEKRTKAHRRKRRQTRNLGLHRNRNRNLNLNLDVSRFASSESTQVNENLGLDESTIDRQHFISTTTREDEFPSIHEPAYETNSEMNSDSESESDWNLEEIEYRDEQLRQQRNHAQQQQQ